MKRMRSQAHSGWDMNNLMQTYHLSWDYIWLKDSGLFFRSVFGHCLSQLQPLCMVCTTLAWSQAAAATSSLHSVVYSGGVTQVDHAATQDACKWSLVACLLRAFVPRFYMMNRTSGDLGSLSLSCTCFYTCKVIEVAVWRKQKFKHCLTITPQTWSVAAQSQMLQKVTVVRRSPPPILPSERGFHF